MYLDLTHPFTTQMPVFPGDPTAKVTITEFGGTMSSELRTGLHVGTHIDAPLHFIPSGKRISDFPPETFFGPGVVIDARSSTDSSPRGEGRGVRSGSFDFTLPLNIISGSIVLIHTGWSKKFRDPDYYENYPVISEAFAEKLIDRGVKIVGLDTPSPDIAPYNIHKLLLSHNILIVENLANLESLLPYKEFEIVALPVKLEAEASPVRVIAKL